MITTSCLGRSFLPVSNPSISLMIFCEERTRDNWLQEISTYVQQKKSTRQNSKAHKCATDLFIAQRHCCYKNGSFTLLLRDLHRLCSFFEAPGRLLTPFFLRKLAQVLTTKTATKRLDRPATATPNRYTPNRLRAHWQPICKTWRLHIKWEIDKRLTKTLELTIPSKTFPKQVCLPSNHDVLMVVM